MFLKVILTGFAMVALALAQDTGGMGGDTGGMGGGGGGGKNGGGMSGASMGSAPKISKPTKFEMFSDRLKLNKDQKNEIGTMLEATAKEASPMVQQVSQARGAYATALANGKSATDLEPLAKAVADAQFQMTGVEVRAMQKVIALLKPNQLAKAPEAFDIMAEIFIPQQSAGARGMGRGGNSGGGR